jgi:hypothetical protein
MIDFTKKPSEELWTSYESIVHANFALNNNIKLIRRMIEQGLIDGNVEAGKKHAISLNNIIEQIQAQIKRSNDATKQIKNILNSLKDGNNC